jgi:hypothetical protein
MSENTEIGRVSIPFQRELEAHYCSEEKFRQEYMCTFEPDPQVEECVKFLRRSLPEDMRIARRDNYFTPEVFKEAKRILNSI